MTRVAVLLCAVGLVACSTPSTGEVGRARVEGAPSLTRMHELLSAPGGLTAPAWAQDYFNGDEIPEEAMSIEAKLVDLDEQEGVAGYARKRIAATVEELRYDAEQDTGDVLFLFNYPDTDWVMQSGSDVRDVLLALVPDTAIPGQSETVKAAVTAVLDEGASYYHFRALDASAEMIANELLIVQPATADADNRALEIQIGCCGGY